METQFDNIIKKYSNEKLLTFGEIFKESTMGTTLRKLLTSIVIRKLLKNENPI